MNVPSSSVMSAPAVKPAALALSGGGLRAALFQQGCFLALAMREELLSIKHVGAISGGTLAALALRQAHTEVDEAKTKDLSSLAREVTVAMHAQRYLTRLASRNIRTRAALSWKTVASAILFRAVNISRRIADDLNNASRRYALVNTEPFHLYVGVHDLKERKLACITVDKNTDVGMLAAAAMTIPGVMESLVISQLNRPVCDGGVDDKTALLVLGTAGVASGILVLDASTEVCVDVRCAAPPVTTLLMLMERASETARAADFAESTQVVGWVSLRDAHKTGNAHSSPLDDSMLAHLRQTRTDLNHFSAVEQLALSAAGFVTTLIERGESCESIIAKARSLATLTLHDGKGQCSYPLASSFDAVCRVLLKQQEVIRADRFGRIMSLGRSPVRDSLSIVIEKSRRSIGQDVLSGQAFSVIIGLLTMGLGSTIIVACLLLPWLALWGGANALASLTHMSLWLAVAVFWILSGLVLSAMAFARARALGTAATPWTLFAGVVSLPLLIPVIIAVRIAILSVQEGEPAWSLGFTQNMLGRLRGLISLGDMRRRSRGNLAITLLISILVFLFAVANPVAIAHCFYPVEIHAIVPLAARGTWLQGVFEYSPLQPVTLAFFALELAVLMLLKIKKAISPKPVLFPRNPFAS